MKKINLIKIEKAVYGGYGLCYHDGRTIFVHLGVPDDIVDIIITEEKKGHSFAEIDKVIKSSEHRIDPVCKNFGICGGCSYLNVNYETEIRIKKNAVLDNLKRIAGFDAELLDKIDREMGIVSGERFYYRSHATLKSNNSKTGFYKKGTNEHVPFDKDGCMLLDKKLNSFIVDASFKDKETRVALDKNNRIYTSLDKNSLIEESEYNINYKRGINQFFQVNKFLRSKMLKIVSDLAALKENEKFIDFGCGVGFFSIFLGKKTFQGIGIDLSSESIKYAKKNSQLNNVNNIKFYRQSISDFNKFNFDPKVVIVDPPRAGISKKGRKTIGAIKPEKIVYVSCNPSTFSRDLKDFIKYGYRLKEIWMIDMFPCTHHIELITLLSK